MDIAVVLVLGRLVSLSHASQQVAALLGLVKQMRGHVDDDVQLVLELLEGLVGNALGPVTGVTGVFLSVTLDVGGHVVG